MLSRSPDPVCSVPVIPVIIFIHKFTKDVHIYKVGGSSLRLLTGTEKIMFFSKDYMAGARRKLVSMSEQVFLLLGRCC